MSLTLIPYRRSIVAAFSPNVAKLRIAAMLVMAIALQCAVIRHLAVEGLIDKIIPWDDCSYIYRGIHNAYSMNHGFWHNLEIVHSPLSIAPSTVAALIAPHSDVAPYAVNFIYLSALFLFINSLLKNNRFSAVVAFALVLFTTPFISVFTEHIKADFHGGMLFFMLTSFLFRGEYRINSPTSGITWPLILIVLILMAKPMAFYVPVLLSVLFILSAVFHSIDSPSRLQIAVIIKYHLILIGLVLVVYSCLVLPNFEYFKQYTAWALSPKFTNTHLTIWQKIFYYAPFLKTGITEHEKFWGSNYTSYAVILASFIGTLISIAERKKIIAGAGLLLLVIIAAWLPVTLSPQFQWSFGSFFAAALISLIFYMFREIQQTSRFAWIINLVIIVASLAVFSLPDRSIQKFLPVGAASTNQAREIVDTFVSKMDPNNLDNAKRPNVFFPFSGPIPDFDFGIRYFRKYSELPSGLVESLSVDNAVIDGGLAPYNYVIMIGNETRLEGGSEANRRVMYYQNQIRKGWNLQELSRLPLDGNEYILYKVVSRKN